MPRPRKTSSPKRRRETRANNAVDYNEENDDDFQGFVVEDGDGSTLPTEPPTPEIPTGQVNICPECNKEFVDMFSLYNHVPVSQVMKQLLETPPADIPKTSFDCMRAMLSGNRNKPRDNQRCIDCPWCSKKFSSYGGFRYHIDRCMLDDKSSLDKSSCYTCSHCSASFAAMSFLRRHMATKHQEWLPQGPEAPPQEDCERQTTSLATQKHVLYQRLRDLLVTDNGTDYTCAACRSFWPSWDAGKDHALKQHEEQIGSPYVLTNGFVFKKPMFRQKSFDCKSTVYREQESIAALNETWRRKNYSSQTLFPYWMPSPSDWVAVTRPNDYAPYQELSVPFVCLSSGSESAAVELPLFGSQVDRGVATTFTGGPVWALDWMPDGGPYTRRPCPHTDSHPDTDSRPDTEHPPDTNQYAALACHTRLTETHTLDCTADGPSLVQVWNFGPLLQGGALSDAPAMELGIGHEDGRVWDVKWCPSGCRTAGTPLSRLGVLAVACATGRVLIYSVPRTNSATVEYKSRIFHPEPALVLTNTGPASSCRCLSWLPSDQHNKLAGGFADGRVSVWRVVATSSPFLRGHGNAVLPLLSFAAHSTAVSSIFWICTATSLGTTSHDRFVRLWDLRNLSFPTKAVKVGGFNDCDINPLAHTIFATRNKLLLGGNTVGVIGVPMTSEVDNTSLTFTAHNSRVWSCSYSRWSGALASCDAAGELVVIRLPANNMALFFADRVSKTPTILRHPLYRIELNISDPERIRSSGGDQAQDSKDQNGSPRDHDISLSPPDLSSGGEACSCCQSNCVGLKSWDIGRMLQQSRRALVLRDTVFPKALNKNSAQVKRLRNGANMNDIDVRRWPIQSLHRVRWNPNSESHAWLLSGGAAGLLRLHYCEVMESNSAYSLSESGNSTRSEIDEIRYISSL